MLGNLWRKLSASFSIPRRLNFLRGSPPKGKQSRADRFRPTVEALDDRTLPSGFSLGSGAFGEGRSIPIQFASSQRGSNQSPPLKWKDPPAGTMSFALLMDDPDAPGGTFNHWVLFDLPANTLALPARIPRRAALPNGALQGTNENGEIGYLGPNPPRRQRHTYVFRVFALDTPQLTLTLVPGIQIPLGAGATKPELLFAMAGHVLDQAPLRGTFKRLFSRS